MCVPMCICVYMCVYVCTCVHVCAAAWRDAIWCARISTIQYLCGVVTLFGGIGVVFVGDVTGKIKYRKA